MRLFGFEIMDGVLYDNQVKSIELLRDDRISYSRDLEDTRIKLKQSNMALTELTRKITSHEVVMNEQRVALEANLAREQEIGQRALDSQKESEIWKGIVNKRESYVETVRTQLSLFKDEYNSYMNLGKVNPTVRADAKEKFLQALHDLEYVVEKGIKPEMPADAVVPTAPFDPNEPELPPLPSSADDMPF